MKIPNIKNAYGNIKEACDERLGQLYSAGIPELVESRYRAELSYLEESEQINDFEIFRCLVKESESCAGYVMVRGTAGGSFLVYLMGHSLVNPLPAHYYCEKCGYFETTDTAVFGIDLPESSCPSCGSTLRSDGFDLSVESVWGTDGKKRIDFDYNANRGIYPFARKLLEKLFPRNKTVPYGMLARRNGQVYMDPYGFVILPEERGLDDYPDMIEYLDDGEECLSGDIRTLEENFLYRVMICPNELCDDLVAMQQKTGAYIRELPGREVSSITWKNIVNTRIYPEITTVIFEAMKPKNFTEMISAEACGHSSYAGCRKENAYASAMARVEMMHSAESLGYQFFAREDVFDALISTGISRKKAYEVMEFARKGKAGTKNKEHAKILDGYGLPEDMEKVLRKCQYLFPRAHCAWYLLDFARLAYYMKMDSRGYSQAVRAHRNALEKM